MEGRSGKKSARHVYVLESHHKRLELDSGQKVDVQEILTEHFKDIYSNSVKMGECSINIYEDCCIYRVPNRIRNVKPEAYTPQMVVIGPLHRLKSTVINGGETSSKSWYLREEYSEMEEIKEIYLKYFTERVGKDTIELMKKIIGAHEKKIRRSYKETIGWINSEDFVDIILQDSLFIVEFIIRHYEVEEGIIEKSGEQFPFDIEMVKNDLIMLENQLPIFILDIFIRPIMNGVLLRTSSFEKIISRFFGLFFSNYITSFKHFTDMFRGFYEHSLDSNIKEHMIKDSSGWPAIKEIRRSVEKLSEAGVKFKSSDNLDFSRNKYHWDVPGGHYAKFARQMSRIRAPEERRVKKRDNKERAVGFSLHVGFENGTLSMPEFLANKVSDMILRNVIAYEQSHPAVIPFTSNYIYFLNFLITSVGDVELLIEEGLITNTIGRPIFVVDMVNELQFGVNQGDTSQYHLIAKRLKVHCNSRRKRYWATLNRVYFTDLWTGTATTTAVLLLIMTLVSTVATVIQTYKSF